jgi:hypothetical protein
MVVVIRRPAQQLEGDRVEYRRLIEDLVAVLILCSGIVELGETPIRMPSSRRRPKGTHTRVPGRSAPCPGGGR